MKLLVEESESQALLAALQGGAPYVTSVVGEIETARVCRRAGVPQTQFEEVRNGLTIIALDEPVVRLAAAAEPTTLRTLDSIHLGTALSLRNDVDAFVTYDARLADAARGAGLPAISPS